MNIVDAPLADGGARTARHPSVAGRSMMRAMTIGQHLMALLLVAIGTGRAVADGVPTALLAVVAVALLGWHTAGALTLSDGAGARRVAGWLLGLTLVWVLAVALSAEFVWFAFLLWLLAGHLLPVRSGLVFSLGVLIVVVLGPVLHHSTTTAAMVVGPLIGGMFAYGISRGYLQLLRDAVERERLVDSLTHAQAEMADLQDELARTQRRSGAMAERTRISRDIHDTVAQSLSSIRLLAHAGAADTDRPQTRRTLEQVAMLAGDGLSDVRRIVSELAPAELEDHELVAALRRMLDRAHEETGVAVDLRVDDTLPALPSEVEVALLRTAQSALANVRLHAAAGRVVMSLIDDETRVRLDVVDDGTGFDVAQWEQHGDPLTASYGLRFMRARLRELGGGLEIESVPGQGTALSIHCPIRGRDGVAAQSGPPPPDRSQRSATGATKERR